MLQLQLLRHGKSDWDADYGADHERPLATRGRKAALAMGRFVTAAGLIPEAAVSSTAVRAKTTLELAVEGGGWEIPTWSERQFYGTGPDTIMREVSSLSSDYGSVMIVGHQPTWGGLVALLTGAHVDFTTASLAVVAFDTTNWSRVSAKSGILRLFVPGRTAQALYG